MENTTNKLLFIGQAPSQESDGQPPFTGRCGKFLASLLDTTQDKMLEDYDFVNVFERWQGKDVGGDKFPHLEASVKAKAMIPSLSGRTVVLLGHNVARAFGAQGFRYFEYYTIRNPQKREQIIVPLMSVMPHPSGRVRYWNIPDNRELARKFLNSLKVQTKPRNV